MRGHGANIGQVVAAGQCEAEYASVHGCDSTAGGRTKPFPPNRGYSNIPGGGNCYTKGEAAVSEGSEACESEVHFQNRDVSEMSVDPVLGIDVSEAAHALATVVTPSQAESLRAAIRAHGTGIAAPSLRMDLLLELLAQHAGSA